MSGPRQVGQFGHTAFVPDGDSRSETAILLLGAARDAGLDDVRAVRATQGGFYISDELADLLYDEQDEAEPEAEPEPPKKNASGNRAAKNSTTTKE